MALPPRSGIHYLDVQVSPVKRSDPLGVAERYESAAFIDVGREPLAVARDSMHAVDLAGEMATLTTNEGEHRADEEQQDK